MSVGCGICIYCKFSSISVEFNKFRGDRDWAKLLGDCWHTHLLIRQVREVLGRLSSTLMWTLHVEFLTIASFWYLANLGWLRLRIIARWLWTHVVIVSTWTCRFGEFERSLNSYARHLVLWFMQLAHSSFFATFCLTPFIIQCMWALGGIVHYECVVLVHGCYFLIGLCHFLEFSCIMNLMLVHFAFGRLLAICLLDVHANFHLCKFFSHVAKPLATLPHVSNEHVGPFEPWVSHNGINYTSLKILRRESWILGHLGCKPIVSSTRSLERMGNHQIRCLICIKIENCEKLSPQNSLLDEIWSTQS